MRTPMVVESAAQPARRQRQQRRSSRLHRSPEYVPYRRRSAAGRLRVATGLAGRREDGGSQDPTR